VRLFLSFFSKRGTDLETLLSNISLFIVVVWTNIRRGPGILAYPGTWKLYFTPCNPLDKLVIIRNMPLVEEREVGGKNLQICFVLVPRTRMLN
jgi:hypothetical protein